MKKQYLLTIIGFLLVIGFAKSQDAKLQSLYIYNFAKYIEWPENYKSGDFVIGVLGNSPIYQELDQLTKGRRIGQQSIKVQVFYTLESIEKCHMLFIPENNSKILENTLIHLSDFPTLVITEKEGLGRKGSSINFVFQDDKLKFELNRGNVKNHGLKMDSNLALLAILVD